MPFTTRSIQLRNSATSQYQEAKQTEETKIEINRNDSIYFSNSASSGKLVIVNETAQRHKCKKHLISFDVPSSNANNIEVIDDDAKVIHTMFSETS